MTAMSSSGGVIGIVLAGGKSSRMGGGDKALLPLGRRPLLAHVVARLRPQVTGKSLHHHCRCRYAVLPHRTCEGALCGDEHN